eukprot:1510340-Rhodomonas_salina.1
MCIRDRSGTELRDAPTRGTRHVGRSRRRRWPAAGRSAPPYGGAAAVYRGAAAVYGGSAAV